MGFVKSNKTIVKGGMLIYETQPKMWLIHMCNTLKHNFIIFRYNLKTY